MICMKTTDVKPIQMKELKYEGKTVEVVNTWVRWLTHKNLGGSEYQHNHALRYFTVGAKGDIPVHNHKYTEIVYMLRGKVLFTSSKDGEIEEREIEPGDFVYTYAFEPHSFRNLSDTEPANFLCCIDCVDDKQNCAPPV
jgi:quercetin dioxygenase-like cupin family protein